MIIDIVDKLKEAANKAWASAETVSNLREPDKDNDFGRECMLLLDAAEKITHLRAQVEAKENEGRLAFREKFVGWLNALRCQNKAIRRRNKHIRSLQKKVKELSQYPEEAVRAVYEYTRELCSEVSYPLYELECDRLAAIFKEKQGVGKCTLPK